MSRRVNGIISLDIASISTGWCYTVKDKVKEFGKIFIKADKLSIPERLSIFRKNLKIILCKYHPTYVVIENGFASRNISTLKILSNFSGVAKECCVTELNVVPYVMNNKTVKSYFNVGTKEALYECIVTNYLYEFKLSFDEHNDITDAYAQAVCYYNTVIKGETNNE